MNRARLSCLTATAMLSLLLAGCGKKSNENNLATLDAQLTNNTSDPALREALESPVTVDPDLTSQSNRHSVRPSDTPLDGAVPVELGARPTVAQLEKAAGGKLMSAPAATKADSEELVPVTLGALAKQQRSGSQTKRDCPASRLSYAMEWAQRLPAAFPIYPGGQLQEAAGADNGPCGIRAVSFTTKAPVQDVLDFYYTTATRARFNAERQIRDGQDVLGGTRTSDDGAYLVMVQPVRGGGASVDIIVNGGL
ncbi:hypothetical protein [Sphingobium subterraneum]|uniref:Lipoprotein n=1 Tax=Sphingobium subterraneum TaxID=627688 RepID=A0A841J5Q5_9SPHN|nr:hypothetical protein [Sphingobium subterraneum]MBB6123875.1 hypothetical protein [Sphingobium subterraneum]